MLSILKRRINRIGSVVPTIFCTVLAGAMTVQQTAIQAEHLRIERLVSLPSLTGTAPINPVWSPDSSRLAFLWNDKALPFRDVWVVSAKDMKPKQITDMAHDFPYPEKKVSDPYKVLVQKAEARARGGVSDVIWTPDGKALIFSYQRDLFLVQADGTNLKRLTQTKGGEYILAFSPDGKFLSYLQEGDLWLWNQESDEIVQATRYGVPSIGIVPGARHTRLDAEVSSYKWSPDSRHIVLHFNDRRNIRKLLIPNYLTEETTVQTLRRDYTQDKNIISELAIYSLEKGSLKMIDLEGKRDFIIGKYSWSPDGNRLLIDQNTGTAPRRLIYVVNVMDGSIQEIWRDNANQQSYTSPWNSEWQSNSKGILFLSDLDGFVHLYALSLNEHTPEQLTKGNWSIINQMGYTPASLTVSSNTKEVYFVSSKKNPYERQVYKIPETGSKITQLTSLPGCHTPVVSPDGLKIALLHSSDVTHHACALGIEQVELVKLDGVCPCVLERGQILRLLLHDTFMLAAKHLSHRYWTDRDRLTFDFIMSVVVIAPCRTRERPIFCKRCGYRSVQQDGCKSTLAVVVPEDFPRRARDGDRF